LTEADIDDQVEAAWRRLGQRFMVQWRAGNERRVPWALREFGEP
jgi:hypothetical protein